MSETLWKTVTNQPGGRGSNCRRSIATGVTLEKTRQFKKTRPKALKLEINHKMLQATAMKLPTSHRL